MKFFPLYLRGHIKSLLYFVYSFAVIFFVFVLYRVQLETVIYSLFLCLLGAAFFAAFDIFNSYRKYKLLEDLKKSVSHGISTLPGASGPVSEQYNELVMMFNDENSRIKSDFDNRISDMTDYYTVWAHQIKTPIAAMRLLLQTDNGENNREISMELFRIEQYVEMVLGYLRLDSGINDFVIQKYELDSIIKQSVRKYSKQFILKKISLDFKETGLQVITDEKWLAFIIEQIISNSLKYTEKGKITISAENGILSVCDTGIGIAQEDLPRVFEKGYTGYNGRTDKKSTGIGLYLCSRTCKKLGHKINISSVVGVGTTVRIDLNSTDLKVE